ncbi:MAG: hypothetical protein GX458_10230 [Phyllobacteriaceae bacterium]|nr:hypothetical protein [Phyllobacteriaceae bacterium]
MTVSTPIARLLLAPALVAAVLLSGCGRKAEPERPTLAGPTEARPVGIPIAPTAPAPQPEKPTKKSFILDPLL